MKQKQIIRYIKNNTEKEIELNIFNKSIINKELLEATTQEEKMNIKKELELINFKNINFTGTKEINCKNDSICILDNCSFTQQKFTRTLTFSNGNFQIINPKTEKTKTIQLIDTKDVVFDFNDKDEYEIETAIMHESGNKIEINSNDSVKNITLKCKQAHLNGIFNIKNFQLECTKNLSIGNQNKTTIINLLNWGGRIETKKLNLTNCIITNDSNLLPLNITYKELSGENFIIKSKTDIIINDETFSKPKDKDGYIIITEKELVEENFKDFLKKLSKEIELEAIAEAENTIPEKFGKHLLDQMEKTTKEIEKQEIILENLRNKYNNQKQKLQSTREEHKNKLVKKLKRKSINDFI